MLAKFASPLTTASCQGKRHEYDGSISHLWESQMQRNPAGFPALVCTTRASRSAPPSATVIKADLLSNSETHQTKVLSINFVRILLVSQHA